MGKLSLILRYLYVGLIGFGGGSALIPVVEKEIVERLGAISTRQYDRHVVVANITPGALPVKLAAATGCSLRLPLLSLGCALAVTLPGVGATIALLELSNLLGPEAVKHISYLSVGIAIFIIALLIGYIIKVHRHAHGRLGAFIIITAVCALAVGLPTLLETLSHLGISAAGSIVENGKVPHLSAVTLIVVALGLIMAYALFTQWQEKRHAKNPGGGPTLATGRAAGARASKTKPHIGSVNAVRPGTRPLKNKSMGAVGGRLGALARGTTFKAMLVFLVFGVCGLVLLGVIGGAEGLELGGLLAFSTVTSFGGGEAYVAVADGFFVQTAMIDSTDFYTQLIPIANALPGPILIKVASGVGYFFGAPHGSLVACAAAVAAVAITVGACCAVAMPILGAYEYLKDHPILVYVGQYILPVICGLLLAVSLTMLNVNAEVSAQADLSGAACIVISVLAVVAVTVIHVKRWVPDIAILLCGALVSWLVFFALA